MGGQSKTPPWGEHGGGFCARYAEESLPISPPSESLDPPLAEQARNRDHHSGGPHGQASKQQNVAQEKRHTRASLDFQKGGPAPIPERGQVTTSKARWMERGISPNPRAAIPILAREFGSKGGTKIPVLCCGIRGTPVRENAMKDLLDNVLLFACIAAFVTGIAFAAVALLG